MPVQSVAFSRNESPATVNGGAGWTAAAARQWARDNGFRDTRVDQTANQLRIRQFQPSECRIDSFRTITRGLPRGVQLIDCELE